MGVGKKAEATTMKHYNDRIPACGVFCGGCPTYTREKNDLFGNKRGIEKMDDANSRLAKCDESFYH